MSYVLLSSNSGVLENIFSNTLNAIFNFVYNISPVYSLGIAIILFTILVKVLLLPLSIKQYTSAKKMKIIQPEIKIVQDKYKNKKDPESQKQFAAEMQAIYAKHGSNPFSGCLPALIQIPIILALFNVLRDAYIYITKLSDIYSSIAAKIMALPNYKELFEPLLKTKHLAIKDINTVDNLKNLVSNITSNEWTSLMSRMPENISATLPSLLNAKTHIENFFTINLTNAPSYTNVSILIPILTALTTYLSIKVTSTANKSKDNSAASDDTAAQIERSMATMIYFIPGLIFITAFSFPSGLGVYWMLGNIISIIQQLLFDKYLIVSTKGGVINETSSKTSKKRK
ncbi:MAG: hypothetical protein A2Y24_02805 [Clostridiales bacterium GWE2_32_10]|nr:MAG: hypothetical protein A2Y24_02805 [Clostridiales bacterium GWE2_32_10]HBY19642.1 hypothetical protein [Clostridiales bacterium]